MTGHRAARLAEEIREATALVLRDEVKDPRVGFVTVTRVDLTPDYRFARIFVSVLGDEKARDQAIQGLERATPFVRRALGKRIRLRFSPEISFVFDKGVAASERVAHLLDEVGPGGEPGGRDGADE